MERESAQVRRAFLIAATILCASCSVVNEHRARNAIENRREAQEHEAKERIASDAETHYIQCVTLYSAGHARSVLNAREVIAAGQTTCISLENIAFQREYEANTPDPDDSDDRHEGKKIAAMRIEAVKEASVGEALKAMAEISK